MSACQSGLRKGVMMEKIEKKWPDNVELRNKVNELVDENTEIIDDIGMSYYKELDRRLKRLEKIEVKRILDNK